MELLPFLKKYGYNLDDFERSGLDWNELLVIKKDHESHLSELETVGGSLTNDMIRTECVHSVKYRIKDSEHLLEKILRKRLDDASFDCDITNYYTKITDLVGVRALHLFKGDWIGIHNSILSKWETQGSPVAKYRKGDADDLIKAYESNGCATEEHKFGYRSIHYIVESRFYKRPALVEIQVRTIFEEGWSEIDHFVRYPYDQNNPVLLPYLTIFNRLAGSADEMGGYLLHLRNTVSKYEEEIEQEKQRIKVLEEHIERLTIEPSEKENLRQDLSQFKFPHAMLDERFRAILPQWSAEFEKSRKTSLVQAFADYKPHSKLLADILENPHKASRYIRQVFDTGAPPESDDSE